MTLPSTPTSRRGGLAEPKAALFQTLDPPRELAPPIAAFVTVYRVARAGVRRGRDEGPPAPPSS